MREGQRYGRKSWGWGNGGEEKDQNFHRCGKILGITLITLLTSGCTDTEKEVLAENKIEANKSMVGKNKEVQV